MFYDWKFETCEWMNEWMVKMFLWWFLSTILNYLNLFCQICWKCFFFLIFVLSLSPFGLVMEFKVLWFVLQVGFPCYAVLHGLKIQTKYNFFLLGHWLGLWWHGWAKPDGVGLGFKKKTCLLNRVDSGFGSGPTGQVWA